MKPEPPVISKLKTVLKKDEGKRNTPYKDLFGHWTVGVGHFLGPEVSKWEFPDSVVEAYLNEDIKEAHRTLERVFGGLTMAAWNEVRYVALMSIAFNLGQWKLSEFKNANRAVMTGNWDDAAKHYMDSLWARQVGDRAKRLCFMLATGTYHADYA